MIRQQRSSLKYIYGILNTEILYIKRKLLNIIKEYGILKNLKTKNSYLSNIAINKNKEMEIRSPTTNRITLYVYHLKREPRMWFKNQKPSSDNKKK